MNKKVYIKTYDIYKLFLNGLKNEREKNIYCTTETLEDAFIKKTLIKDSLLFNQASKLTRINASISSMIIVMDFSSVKDSERKRFINSLKKFENGFRLCIDGIERRYVDFIKSNSMTKESKIYYVDSNYYDELSKRVFLDFDNQMVKMSKWYSHSGLVASNVDICNGLELNYDEVVVLKDKEKIKNVDCITAVSKLSVLFDLQNLVRDLKEHYDKDVLCKDCTFTSVKIFFNKIDAYINSIEFETLSNTKDLILKSKELLELSIKQAITLANKLINEYFIQLDREETVTWEKVTVSNYPIRINEFDGVGLISKEFNQQIVECLKKKDSRKYRNYNDNHYSFQIRLPFIKGVVHTCDLKGFFKEHNIKRIKSWVNYSEKEYEMIDVDKIKMIITESQFKGISYLKNMELDKKYKNELDYYFNKLHEYDYHLGIANDDLEEDKGVTLNYQYLSTLPIEESEINRLIKANQHSILEEVKTDNLMAKLYNNEYCQNDIRIYNLDKDFYTSTSRFINIYKKELTSLCMDSIIGRIRVPGYRRFISPDLLSLLYYSIEKELPSEETLEYNEFYSPLTNKELDEVKAGKTFENEKSIILRNPHYSKNEILILNRVINVDSFRNKYFKHLYSTIMINPLSCAANRLGGADYDGDNVLVINDQSITGKAARDLLIKKDGQYHLKYLHAEIPTIDEKRCKITYANKLISLARSFSSKIGYISNLAYINIDENGDNADNSFFTILSGLEIDSVKNGRKPKLPVKYNTINPFITLKDKVKDENKIDKTDLTNINGLMNNSNIYMIVSKMGKFYFNTRNSKKKTNINVEQLIDYNISKKRIINGLGVFYAVGEINRSISWFKSENRRINNQCNAFLEEFKKIINKNNYDSLDNNLLEELNVSDVSKKIYSFCYGDTKYFFLTKDSDKEEYLKNMDIIISEENKPILFNFKNQGYKSLFYGLMYWNYKNNLKYKMHFNEEKELIGDINETLEITVSELLEIKRVRNDLINKFSDRLTNIKDNDFKQMKLILSSIIKDEYNIRFADIASVVKSILDYNPLFDIFFDQTIDYLSKRKGGND